MYRDPALTKLLAYSGALPFWALALAQVLGYQSPFAAQAFIAYGTGITSFMAGTLWSQAQNRSRSPKVMLVVSNIFALAAIGALLFFALAPKTALAIQALAFLGILAADLDFHRKGDQPAWYLTLRRNVTLIVLAAYGLVLILT